MKHSAKEMSHPEGHQFTLVSKSHDETFSAGKALGQILSAGDIVALIGELGAGKTCFTQGIARGLDVPDVYEITSPTFTLVNEYPGRINLYHLDLYRIQRISDLHSTGYEEYLFGDGVAVVEWADRVHERIPPGTLWIRFQYVNEYERNIEISGGIRNSDQLIRAFGGEDRS